MKRKSLKILIMLAAISFVIQIAQPADILAQEDTATEDLGHYEWGYDGEYSDIYFDDELGIVYDSQTGGAYSYDGEYMGDGFGDSFYGGSSGDDDYGWGDLEYDDYGYDDIVDTELEFPDYYWEGLGPAGDIVNPPVKEDSIDLLKKWDLSTWGSGHSGKAAVIYPQDKVDEKYTTGLPEDTQEFLDKLTPYTDEKRPSGEIVNLGPLMEELAGFEEEALDNTYNYLYYNKASQDAPAVGTARWLATQAMEAQGYQWKDRDETAEELLSGMVGQKRLPSVGYDPDNGPGFEMHPGGWRKPEIEEMPPQITFRGGESTHKKNTLPYTLADAVAHEKAHSWQVLPGADPFDKNSYDIMVRSIEIGRENLAVTAEEMGPTVTQLAMYPGMYRGQASQEPEMHRGQASQEVDLTLVWPSGKETVLSAMGQMARDKHIFTPDPETGEVRTVDYYINNTEVGRKWAASLVGDGQGSAYMGQGENRIDAPWWPEPDPETGVIKGLKTDWSPRQKKDVFTPEAKELLQTDESAAEFLKRLGID